MKKNEKNRILKGYLTHLVYVPIAIINSLIIGEDIGTLGLIIFIALIIGTIALGFNYSITLLGLNLFKSKKLWAFLLPTVIAILLYFPINQLLLFFDFGGKYIYFTFLGISTFINLGTFIFIYLKNRN